MIINPKPGNHPHPNDMSGTFEDGGESQDTATPKHSSEEEEEAARLGDFA